MFDVGTFYQKSRFTLKQQLVNEEPIMAQANLVGEQIAVACVLVTRITVSGWSVK